MKRKGNEVMMKQSRSASDITREILDRKDEFRFFRCRLGARSLSHDSFFLSETRHSDPKPPWALSQETVHAKIQALQIKLQRQKMRLGPPPLVLPMKQTEDNPQSSEVLMSKSLPHKASSQGDFPYPISPTLPPVYSCAPSPVVDFSTRPQLIPFLDNSAARHRMSIKPRNQRASTKSRRTPLSDGSRPRSESMIILERPPPERKAEDGIAITKEITRVRSYSSQIIRPGKGHIAPPTKSPGPFSPPKLLVRADDDSYPCAVGQCKGKEEPAVSNTADGGTKQILKLAEGIVVERSSGPNSRKGSVDHKESLCSSKPKDVEGSAVSVVSSVHTPCLILTGTGQSQPKSDKELNMVTAQIKGNTSNRNDPRVQATVQEYYLQGQPLKSLTLHRNTSPLNNKSESGNMNKISSLLLSKEEGCLQESTIQQPSQSCSVSLDKSQERQRTGSFTEQIEQAEGKQEPVFPLIKPPTNLKTQDLHKNIQVMATGKDPSHTGATSTPAVLTKPRILTINGSAGQERRDRPANKTRYMALETPIEVKEADEVNKKRKMNKISQGQKEERSASELKLDTTYPIKVHDKQHNTEVRSTPWLPQCTAPIAVGPNDSKEPVRETVFRSPPLYNTELFSSSESHVFSNIQPQSARRDQERAGFIRCADLQASTQLAGSTFNITMSTPVHMMEAYPLQTSARDSREVSTELSWMTMAREKTKSLQQLFTSTLNDIAGLQTVTRPTASTLTQISSKCSAGPINLAAAQPSASPLETQLTSTLPASKQAPHKIQPPPLTSSIRLAQPSIDQPGGVDFFSTKPNTSPTSQVQPIHPNARSGQMSADSTLKPVKPTGIYTPSTQIIHASQPQLSQMALHQAYPIQQSLPQSVTKPHASQSLCLSASPKLTPCQPPHQSLSPMSRHRPLVENISSLLLEKMDRTEGQAQYSGGLGSKALLIEQWQHQKPEAVKADQKSTPDSRTYQYLDEFPTISSRSKFTELAVSPRPMRLEREFKWQKTTFSPLSPSSSSSHLQSTREGRQPSWMELAKRKSMAWSDKSMD